MTLRMKNSTNILKQLKSKMGLLSLINQSSCSSIGGHSSRMPLTSPFANDLRSPDSYLCYSPTLFLPHRFESIQAGKQVDSVCGSVNNQVY